MKLKHLIESDNEDETVDKAPPPGEMGEWITTAQAAKILKVSMSRVRQLIMNNKLKSYPPQPGKRDNTLKTAEVYAYKDKDQNKAGRPSKDEEKEDKK